MKKVCITIPIYKEKMSEVERASLLQCLRVLGKYDIYLFGPTELNMSEYSELLKDKFNYVSFDKKWFKSVDSYSTFMLTKEFYEKFVNYEFLLIYQLDAWVFRDELEYWCEQGYDYLGAPWFEDKTPIAKMRSKAGNGGLSLRNVSACLHAIKRGAYHTFKQTLDKNDKGNTFLNVLNFPVVIVSYLINKICPKPLFKYKKGEDYVWVYETKLKTIPPEIASKFCFEDKPRRLYEMNNRQLPFGCHAFEKIEWDFWKEFINVREGFNEQ